MNDGFVTGMLRQSRTVALVEQVGLAGVVLCPDTDQTELCVQ